MEYRGRSRLISAIGFACSVLALGIVFATPRVAAAQTGKITGIVTDAASGAPIEGAQIHLDGTGYGNQTSANGRYVILGIPPGTYTVIAQRLGYARVEVSNVTVRIDVTRDLAIQMTSSATELQTVRITAEEAPLIEQGAVGSQTTITAEQIQSLPVTSIAGVLELQQGFIDPPQNTNLQSLAEEQRSTLQPIRVRGGRGGATIGLIDNFPINNPITGAEAIRLNSFAVSQVDFTRGYMEPQYGNGLSGAINQATREGGTTVSGAIDYQTSSVAGALGSTPDELLGRNIIRGFLAGPFPGTQDKLRYAVSGEIQTGANRVLEFDDDVFSFNRAQTFPDLPPDVLDLQSGWRAFGGTQNQQIVGKLTFLPSTTNKLNFLVIDQRRQNLGYDRRLLLVATGDPWDIVTNLVDSLGESGQRNFRNVTQASVRDQSRLYGVSFEQRFGRSTLKLSGYQLDFERNTCNIFLGTCVPQPFVLANFREQFIAPFNVDGIPFPGSGLAFGGEEYTTNGIRGDIQSQVTDHHLLKFGASWLRHDIVYNEIRGIDGNSGKAATVNQLYRAKPIEAALYLQDRIEYDFLTINLGARFDYGKAEGLGFTNPLDPTNGTTAREVCNGTVPGLSTTPFTREVAPDSILTGAIACLGTDSISGVLLDSARRMAQLDDFHEAEARKAFSPRIGVNFPLTERSAVFFNAGRYTMNPLYHNLYRNSGIGTHAGPEDAFCKENEVKPGTDECAPPLTNNNPDFIGNPNLLLEQATQYEVGFQSEIGRAYAVNVAVFNRDESGLSGLVDSRSTQDIGVTYNQQSIPSYSTIVNQDFLTARGLEVQFRRRMLNHWRFDINYGWSRSTTNSPPPDRSFESDEAGEVDRTARREIISDIDQTQRLNLTFGLGVQNDAPDFRFGNLLRNTDLTFTFSYNSGFPYTPSRATTIGGTFNEGNDLEPNSGRAPSTQTVNAIFRKRFRVGAVQYGAFVRVSNLFDRKNCVQVFPNTGTCESGLRDFRNRRVGNFGESTSTNIDQPEFIGARRSIFTGLSLNF